MNQRDLDRKLMAWLDDPFTPPAPSYLGEVLERTRRTRQRRAWASLERWLPMTLTLRRPMLAPPMRLFAIGLTLLLALLGAMALAPILSQPSRLAAAVTSWSNGVIAFDRDGDIWVVDPNVGEPSVLIGGVETDEAPDWSPDGTRLAFWRTMLGETSLMIAEADGSNVIDVTADPVIDARIFVWSPDGTQIAMTSQDPAVTLLATDGNDSRALDLGLSAVDSVYWHPDGKSLLVRAETADGTSLFPVSLPDGVLGEPILTSDVTSAFYAGDNGINDLYGPSYSHDGSMLAWSNGVLLPAGHAPRSFPYSRSYVAKADGSEVTPLEYSPDSDDEDGATWSPDGSRLSIHLRHGDDDRMSIHTIDGSRPVVVTDSEANPGSWLGHIWSPNGTSLLTWRGGDGRTALVDTATGVTTPLPWLGGPADWQPLAAQP